MERSTKKTGYLLSGVFVLALLVRLVATARFGIDSFGYSEGSIIGSSMAQGNGFVFDLFRLPGVAPMRSFIPPLYPYFVWLAIELNPSNAAASLHLLQALLSSLATLLMYGIGRKLTNSPLVGLLCALAFALYPIYVVTTSIPQSLPLSSFCMLLLLWLTLCVDDAQSSNATAIALGVAYGLTLLIRPIMAGYAPILLLWLWLNKRERSTKWLLQIYATVGIVSMLMVLPWQLRNYRLHNAFFWMSTNGGMTFWNGNNPFTTGSGLEVDARKLATYLGEEFDANSPEVIDQLQPYQLPLEMSDLTMLTEVEIDRELRNAGLNYIREHAGETLQLAQRKLTNFVWFRPNIGASYSEETWIGYYKIIYAAVLAVALVGMGMARKHWRQFALFWLVIGFYLAVYAIFHVQTRYRWDIEYMLLIFCALPMTKLLRRPASWLGIEDNYESTTAVS